MSIFITNMPILNMNLNKNDIEIMKIVASHKTTTEPEIREEQKKQQMEKLRQNNWTYLKKLIEAGFVEKAGFEKKEGQKKEGRRLEKYRLTKTGLNKIMPEFDSFDDFVMQNVSTANVVNKYLVVNDPKELVCGEVDASRGFVL